MLTTITLENAQKWDDVVRTFSNRDVYWLSGYTKAFEHHGDGKPILLLYENEGIRAINVVMLRDISNDERFCGRIEKNRVFDLSTAYGYGGWLLDEGGFDSTTVSLFEEEITEWCLANNIVSEFVRFHPVLENETVFNDCMYEKVYMGKTVAIELDDQELIWDRYTSKNRGHIRKAIKEGVEVRVSNSDEAFAIFRDIYRTTMDNDDADKYYYFDDKFFESVRNDLKDNSMVYTAYLRDTPIAAAIMLFENRYMSYHLSGQLFEYRKFAGTNMIIHEAAIWGCKNGFQWLHLGGGLGAQEGSLYDFKKAFYQKGEDKEFYIGKKIFNEEVYKELVDMRGLSLDISFFPQYRAE